MDVDPTHGEELEGLIKKVMDQPKEVVDRVKKVLGTRLRLEALEDREAVYATGVNIDQETLAPGFFVRTARGRFSWRNSG